MSNVNENVIIVMVEDDEGHARLIEKNLRRAGIMNEIQHFTTGRAAVEYFKNNASRSKDDRTLVLLDLNLPEMDGYDVLAYMKSNEHTKAIPIIILTTTDNPKEIDRCYELGCNVYITKPVEYESFCEAIRKLGLMLAVVKIPHVA